MKWLAVCIGFAFVSSIEASASELAAEKFISAAESMADRPAAPRDKAASLRKIFDASRSVLAKTSPEMSDDQLHRSFDVTEFAYLLSDTADYGSRRQYIDLMGNVINELQVRDAYRFEEVDAYHDHLMMSRDFAGASRIRARFPGISFRDHGRFDMSTKGIPKGVAAYVADGGGRLELVRPDIPDDGTYVVVTIGCHFAIDAARAIAGRPVLARLMASDRVVWLMPDSELDQRELDRWNASFPMFAAMIAFDNAQWRSVDFTETPGFHFFKDGKLAGYRSGWGDESLGELEAMLRDIGVEVD
jgi:hypothetical protein